MKGRQCLDRALVLNCHIMLEHAEKKPFQCDQCTQSYTSKEGVKRHKLTVHEGNQKHVIYRIYLISP